MAYARVYTYYVHMCDMYIMVFVHYVGMCTHTWVRMDISAVCTCMYVVHVCMTALADQWHRKMTRRDHPIASDG